MPPIGVIAGSGLYEIEGLRPIRDVALKTPYGEPSAPYSIGELSAGEIAFLPRHGSPHRIPPAQVNYRANLWGFRELGVERVISVNATGGINPALRHGDIVVADQVIDMTQGARASTFYDGDEVVHIDFTEPYCPELREAMLAAGRNTGTPLRDGGTYVCVNGPRLESRAEIGYFAKIGGDIVGMTGMPETSLARELELCICSVSVVTNYAAGLSGRKLTTTEVVRTMEASTEKIKGLLRELLDLVPAGRACPCKDALSDARM